MGHRYYDPSLGRFTQPDPSGQETNPYLYAGGDPINNVDPSGLDFLGWDGGQWASAAGVAASVAGAFAGGPLGIGLAAVRRASASPARLCRETPSDRPSPPESWARRPVE